MFEIEFFQDRNGNEPIMDFIYELRNKAKTSKIDRIRVDKILTHIRVLERMGTAAGPPYIKHIDDDIWELSSLKDRIFFFLFKDNTYVLLHHFLKTTNRTPMKDLKQAQRNKADYIERSRENGQ